MFRFEKFSYVHLGVAFEHKENSCKDEFLSRLETMGEVRVHLFNTDEDKSIF